MRFTFRLRAVLYVFYFYIFIYYLLFYLSLFFYLTLRMRAQGLHPNAFPLFVLR